MAMMNEISHWLQKQYYYHRLPSACSIIWTAHSYLYAGTDTVDILLYWIWSCCPACIDAVWAFLCFFCFIDQSAATRQIPAHLFYLWKWNGFNYSVESLNIEQTCVGTLQSSFKRENGLVGSERLGPVPWTCDWNRVQTRFCFLLKPWRILTCGWKDCDRFSS